MVTRIQASRNPSYKRSGPKSLIHALSKYNYAPTKLPARFYRNEQNKLFMKNDDGSSTEVSAENQQDDAFWLAPVTIGTPGQKLMLNFDTGSSDLWIWSTSLDKKILEAGKELGNQAFDPKESSTYEPMRDSSWKITYGDQSGASGIVGTDTVKIGDIAVENQCIELATKISKQFIQNAGSGLLGLAFGSINTVEPVPQATPVENMIKQKDIPTSMSLFTAYLGSHKDVNDPDKGESFFTFGGIDQNVVEESGQDINWTPVDNSQGFWDFNSAVATIDDEEFPMDGNRAIADTGTTLWIARDDLCEAIYKKIPGAKLDEEVGGYIYPADVEISALPQITVAIGDKQFAIEKEHLSFAPVDETGKMIFGGIQPRDPQMPFDIMGDTVLMGLYAIFDVGMKRFGCVQRADPTPEGATPTNGHTNGAAKTGQ